jgi:hypothetical protein
MKGTVVIKQISLREVKNLIKYGYVGNASGGFYDLSRFKNEVENDKSNFIPMQEKYNRSHIGYYKTIGGQRYMEDRFVDISKELK